jgi:hypothetical protein
VTTNQNPPPAGLCHRCQKSIPAGAGTLVQIDQGTGASPDILIHTDPCPPLHVRRSQG